MIDLLAEPLKTDIAWQFVNALLPSEATTMYGRVFQVFTSALFFLGGLFFAYQFVQGIVASARTGQALGERWHTIWTPLRVVIGLGLLAPMPQTGFSSVHYLLRDFVARPGVNLGNALSNTGITTVVKEGVTITPASSNGSSIAMTVLRHEVCAAVYNQSGSLWGWEARLPDPEGAETGTGIFGSERRHTWAYGPTCGQFSLSALDDRQSFSKARREAIKAFVVAFRVEAGRYARLAAETSGLSSAGAAAKAVTSKVLSPDLVQNIRSMGAAYDRAITAAAKEEAKTIAAGSRKALVKDASEQGFLTTGMYWRTLAQISDVTTSMTNERPEDTPPRVDGDFGEAIAKAFAALRLQVSGEAERQALSANDFAAAGDETADLATKILAPISRSIIEWAGTPADDGQDRDEMGALISSGHAMMAGVTAAIAAGGIAAGVAGNEILEFFGASAVNYFLDWSKFVIIPVWIIGALRAYVIPFMPHVFMLVSGVALLASLMEAMIALPLWCLRWLKMDGNDDFVGDSVKLGLLFTVNIFLRPALAVLAVFAAYGVFSPVLGMLDRLWATAFLAQTGGHVVGLPGYLLLTFGQTYMIWYVCLKTYGQTWALPDRVLAWFGQAGTAGESGLVSGAFGGMLALAGRGSLPRIVPQGPNKSENPIPEGEKTK
ncbi:DotA/TraY family protein [Agrobacterium salinitolerans]|uniref:DotA/TraY family protein n=1 Tax=Agrobacterium salinitolerans TaxID=1183413 RepID=A0A4Z1R2V1_9HYPH|nr:DotA/TraY family protein [Agrobacterium salinitolerans]UYZ07413.1 DotA/TraY family protein [Agrobacterium salinitolerans]